MATKGYRKDPRLEKLRNDIPLPPNIDEIIRDLMTMPKIHPAYLYHVQEGYMFLQKVCLLLSSTKTSYLYAGWEDLGVKLGLEPTKINSIKYNFHMEDPATYIFLAYVQNDDATIEKIIVSLYEIKRYDILIEIKELLQKACTNILKQFNASNERQIIKPSIIPNVPFIFKNVSKPTNTTNLCNYLRQDEAETNPIDRNTNQRYTKTILLTYSHDAEELVKRLIVHLRKKRKDSRLGILVLNEQKHKLMLCPEEFIYECFQQIDYIFPIVTTQYLNDVTDTKNNVSFSPLENPDHKYVKYIYKLMNTHYLQNGCRNTKVRCLIPDESVHRIVKDPIMMHSLFQIWIRISNIDILIEEILKI